MKKLLFLLLLFSCSPNKHVIVCHGCKEGYKIIEVDSFKYDNGTLMGYRNDTIFVIRTDSIKIKR